MDCTGAARVSLAASMVLGCLYPALPANPASHELSCPHPPDPLPQRGRGRLRVFLCKGLRPLQPRACAGSYTASRKATEARASPRVSLRYCKPPGMQCSVRRRVEAPGMFPEAAPRGFSCRGAGGDSPRQNKLKVSPFPGGEGGSGVYPSPSGKGGRKTCAGAGQSRQRRGKTPKKVTGTAG